ncbi:hypothetical protein H650_13830 [Enterobacter sp. R4-368]|nr:hypothetical protein H650_13830 [Enterobacter sp. R4-368]
MQSGFAVEVLPQEAQVLRHIPVRVAAFPLAASLGGGNALPDNVAAAVGHFFRQTVQLRVIPVNLRVPAAAVDAGQRFVTG